MAESHILYAGTTARTSKRTKRTVFLASAALGAAAFLSDLVPGTLGAVLLTMTSSGFAWGMTALIIGCKQNSWRAAVIGSAATLLIATAVYYGMILGVSQRWRGGSLQDGRSADVVSLLSVGRAASFWTIASLCAGPLLGTIGWKAKSGNERQSTIIIAAAFGLLSSSGFHTLLLRTPWPELNEFGYGFLMAAVLEVLFSALATVYLLKLRKLKPAAPTFVISAVFGVILGVLLWRLAELARVLISV